MAEGPAGHGESPAEKAKEDFFSEAQELVDGLSRDLLALDEQSRKGEGDPELVNDVFRAVHTLKGLAGLFGAARMTALSHQLEDVLDDLRLGRIELTARVLDLLFQSVELYGLILSAEKGQAPDPTREVESLLVALGEISQHRAGGGPNPLSQYDLDPSVLGVLTEYEEHRLRTNIQAGFALYRIRVQFSLATIDSALEELKAKARPHGEIITYLPTGSGGETDSIELEILLASQSTLENLRPAITGPHVSIDEVAKRTQGSTPHPPPAAPVFSQPLSEGSRSLPAHEVLGSTSPPSPHSLPPPGRGTLPPPSASIAPARGGKAGGRDLSLRSVSQTVRVDIRKLDHLMNIVGELAIVRTGLARARERIRGNPALRELGIDLHRLHRAFDRHLTQMQNGILEVRMVPLGQVFEKLARVVRQISREQDKQVNLVITGAETEIDKLIVEELSDPLMHMIRNAIDHGIESRDARVDVAKPPVGTIALNAFQKGNVVIIEVEDDGAGMKREVLLDTAIRKKLVSPAEAEDLSPREVYNLVFLPGFTTREEATDLSGRGVGMDIVKTNIGKLGGVVDITSDPGIGTKIAVTLPITLAIISVLGVEVAGHSFAVPLASVEEAIVLDEGLVRNFNGREGMTQRGVTLPVCRLAQLFGLPERSAGEPLPTRKQRPYVVISQVGERRLGFIVDRLIGQQDIVIKPLGKSLAGVRGFAGATELGDQRVGLVLDVAALIEEVLASEKDIHLGYEKRA